MTTIEFHDKLNLSGYILNKIKFDSSENKILFLLSDGTENYNRLIVFKNTSVFTVTGGQLPDEDEILCQQISIDGELCFTFLDNECIIALKCENIEISKPLSSKVFTSFYIESMAHFENVNESLCRYIPDENSIFNPNDLTNLLTIEPTHWQHGYYIGRPPIISRWEYKICEPAMDAEEQLIRLVRKFTPLIPKIKLKYNVKVGLHIVPHIYNENAPIVGLTPDVIEFCLQIGAEVTSYIAVFETE